MYILLWEAVRIRPGTSVRFFFSFHYPVLFCFCGGAPEKIPGSVSIFSPAATDKATAPVTFVPLQVVQGSPVSLQVTPKLFKLQVQRCYSNSAHGGFLRKPPRSHEVFTELQGVGPSSCRKYTSPRVFGRRGVTWSSRGYRMRTRRMLVRGKFAADEVEEAL